MPRNGIMPSQVPSPMEVADAGLDTVGEIVQAPIRVIGNLARSVANTADKIQGDIRKPIDEGGVPASPGTVIEAGVGVVVDGVTGVFDLVGSGIDGVRQTFDAVRAQASQLTR